MQTISSFVRIPCETEQIFWARRVVRSPSSSPSDLDRAEAILRKSTDWLDLDLAQKLREARIAALRNRQRDTAHAACDTIILPIEPRTRISQETDRRAMRWLAPLSIALIALLIVGSVSKAASLTITATATQVADWRSWR